MLLNNTIIKIDIKKISLNNIIIQILAFFKGKDRFGDRNSFR